MRLPVVLAAIACALTACSSPGTSNASGGEVLDDTVGMRDSIAGTAAASMNENRVLGLLRYTHATDSALGVLGALVLMAVFGGAAGIVGSAADK